MAPLRQEVRYHKVQEAENDDPEEAAVRIYRHSSPSVERSLRSQYTEICLRVVASVLLLAVAAALVLYEVSYGKVEPAATFHRPPGSLEHSWNASLWANILTDYRHDGHDVGSHGPGGHGSHQQEDPEGDREGHGSHQQEDPEGDREGHGSHQQEDPEEDDHEGHGSHHHESSEKQELLPASHRHSAGTYHQAAVVTDSETCSRIGREVLASGGAVVDAGVAAALCLAVIHPHSTSLGGIFSSIYYDGTSYNVSVLNAIPREASPIAYGVPHVLQGLRVLHQRYGRKPWAQLTAAATHLAKQGFLVDAALAAALEARRHAVLSSVELCGLFCEPNNRVKGAGATVRNPKLGAVLEQIATSMTDSALPDSLIQSLASDIAETDREAFVGALSKNNLRTEDPVALHLEEMTLYSTPGPTAGSILADTLKETYRQMPPLKNSTDIHQAYQVLLNVSMATYNKGGGSPRGSSGSPTASPAPVGSSVVVADKHGTVLVMSLSINSTFGSGFVSPSTGILLSDFTRGSQLSPPSSLVFWASPSVLLHVDEDVMGLGATGGSSVPFSVAQVIFTHLVLQKELTVSVQGPLVDLTRGNATGWYAHFGLAGRGAEALGGEYPLAVVAAEVHAEHVHVAKPHGHCCFSDGL